LELLRGRRMIYMILLRAHGMSEWSEILAWKGGIRRSEVSRGDKIGLVIVIGERYGNTGVVRAPWTSRQAC